MVLAMVICECCPANEVDMMISVLMNIFDTRASLIALLKTMIDREIAHTSRSLFIALRLTAHEISQLATRIFSEGIQLAQDFSLPLRAYTGTTICEV
jgi:hypothetical protein